MTNSKLRNSDSAYSICFSQVLLKLFSFLINTADKVKYNIFNSFLGCSLTAPRHNLAMSDSSPTRIPSLLSR